MAASQILSDCVPASVFHKQANIHENVMRDLHHVRKLHHVAATVSFNKYGSLVGLSWSFGSDLDAQMSVYWN